MSVYLSNSIPYMEGTGLVLERPFSEEIRKALTPGAAGDAERHQDLPEDDVQQRNARVERRRYARFRDSFLFECAAEHKKGGGVDEGLRYAYWRIIGRAPSSSLDISKSPWLAFVPL